MKIGIWVNEPIDKISGGSYTYMHTLIAGIDRFDFQSGIEIVFISRLTLVGFVKPVIKITEHQRGIPFVIKLVRKGLKIVSKTAFAGLINFIDQKEKKINDKSAAAYLKEQGVRIIFYPTPGIQVIEGIPFIANNWDLAHHATYPFPEIVDHNGFQNRNHWYINKMVEALMVFSETEAGKKEILFHLNYSPEKIKVLPIFTSNVLIQMQLPYEKQMSYLNNLGLHPQKFFFYPAQFWAHKNHYHLLNAFKKFTMEYPGFKLLLCGSDKGNIDYLKGHAKSLGISDNVIFSGFIEDEALFTLYKNAKALIMPTIFGPSSIPPIEAMHLGCPVLCSDIEGHRETMQNGALYFNPLDDLSLLESMNLIMDDQTRQQMIKDQTELSKVTPHTIERALIKLQEHFLEVINIRNCWE